MKNVVFRQLILCVAVLSLAACGAVDSDPGPGGVTAGDAKALDDAARKLDERDKEALSKDGQ